MPLTSFPLRAMYASANEAALGEGFQKETQHATGEPKPGAGNDPGRPVQEAGPDLRGRADRRRGALPARRRDGTPEPLVRGQAGDGRRRLQRLAVLEPAGRPEARQAPKEPKAGEP